MRVVETLLTLESKLFTRATVAMYQWWTLRNNVREGTLPREVAALAFYAEALLRLLRSMEVIKTVEQSINKNGNDHMWVS